MTEPRRHQSPTGRLEHKIPTLADWGVIKRQAQAYRLAYHDAYLAREGEPIEIDYAAVEERVIASFARRDVDMTMGWWQRYITVGQPVLINKLRGRDNAILTLNDLIHPETLEKMARPLPRATAYPDYGVAPVWLIV